MRDVLCDMGGLCEGSTGGLKLVVALGSPSSERSVVIARCFGKRLAPETHRERIR